jgi:hypothetical protein
VTRRTQRLWKLLLALSVACTFASLAAWAVLLTRICSNPRTPMPKTQHDIAYNCHGMTVFISHLESAMLHWLIPILGLFIVLSLVAAAMAVLAAANVRIDVRIRRTDASGKSARRDDGRG